MHFEVPFFFIHVDEKGIITLKSDSF